MNAGPATAAAALLGAGIAAGAALGIPEGGMLQDSFKSAVVVLAALLAALALAWPRPGGLVLRWHPVLLLPVLLAAYALASTWWAQPWQAGVECVRWLALALIAAVAMQLPGQWKMLARFVAAGAAIASAWLVLQFVAGIDWFPQGARPGSTFVNRNFFAEFAVCALPFAALLRRERPVAAGIASGLIVVAMCMAGSRSALVALAALLAVAAVSWRRSPGPGAFWLGAAVTIAALGFVPTGDASIAAEGRGNSASARAMHRTAAIASGDASTAMRVDLWSATVKSIAAHPVAGTGAGSWEHEDDFHAHNEFLQLIAEYGLAGWAFLCALGAWLVREVRRGRDAWRGALLCSLLALFTVSNAGFPWHLALTAAIFGLCIGGLAADEAREAAVARTPVLLLLAAALALTACTAWVAAQAESRLSRAARIALAIGGTSNPNDARWAASKSEMLRLVDEGMRLHPNERQLTPVVADELGRWGDWPNAIRIWEHVLRSHPNVVVILANVARGYVAIGRPELAAAYLERARRIDPAAPSVRAVDALMRQMSSSKG